MVARFCPSLLARFGLAAAVIAVLVFVAPGVWQAWQGNWTNVAFTQAAFAATARETFDWSGAAIAGYVAAGDEAQAQDRLLSAYQMRWRSAAQVGNVGEGLAAFRAGHSLTADSAKATACTPPDGDRLEAEEFAGVQADSLAIATEINGRRAVLLFAAQPISQSVCLDGAGVYTIAVTAAELGLPPVQVEASWDGWRAGLLTYDHGDHSLHVAEVRVVAPAGAHILTLTFANDFSDPASGVDRNVVIDSVRMIRGMVSDEHQH